ncbi:MAG: aspartate kinase [Deltaproteobacteria bacterium]|nr:aspartate kinase [Deltaproteobacteria bacterium]
MSVIVQKYGGSSVADAQRLQRVARRVMNTVEAGHKVVVVISAMGSTTDDLQRLAGEISQSPPRRELDMLLSAGERISAALLAMALHEGGCDAVSFTGSQCGIITTHRHTNARILEVRPYRVQDELDDGKVVIIAGYQGVSYKREVTTLGRGGSDTTAVAMAAALGAEHCEICSDVDGVYTADPHREGDSRHLPEVSYEQMLELSQYGAKVLNAQAVEFARRQRIVIYARATDGSQRVTRIAAADEGNRNTVGVAGMRDLVAIRGQGGAEGLRSICHVLEESETPALWARLDEGRPLVVLNPDTCPELDTLLAHVTQLVDVEVERRLDAASVVGQGLGDDPTHLSTLLTVAASVNAEVVGLDSASSRLTLLMRHGTLDATLAALHQRFVIELGEGE